MPRPRKHTPFTFIPFSRSLATIMAMPPSFLPFPRHQHLHHHRHRHRQCSPPMDMKRLRRYPTSNSDDGDGGALRVPSDRKWAARLVRLVGFGATCLLLLPVLLLYCRISILNGAGVAAYRLGFHPSPPKDGVGEAALLRESRDKNREDDKQTSLHGMANATIDKLLGGLLVSGFEEGSCDSRYQSSLYRKASPRSPSKYLLEKLRNYEVLHKKCGPNTHLYNRTLDQLNSGHNNGTECSYVVWISYSGLGNRILTLASTFLYALLTDRILLIDRGKDMAYLFCEPFPDTSWLLPLDFPLIGQFNSFDIKSAKSFGNMLKHHIINDRIIDTSAKSLPVFTYLHLAHDYGDHDKLFFCEQDQLVLKNIPWLVLRSDNYFVPSLFLMPEYEEELGRLFPEKDTVFHHLGRYLFHPSNSVWGLISRYYMAYMANADERIGIQIRVFEVDPGPFQYVLDQILACSLQHKVLPEVTKDKMAPLLDSYRKKAVLLTSLNSGYFEKIRNMYWEQATVTGEIVSVFQPSHEVHQQTDNQMHNMKAWAEMYLLSLTDVLVTSSWSTFGYVAQGLGGLRPWLLFKPENQTAPDPPCRRAMSMEPCFHAPPFYDCKAKTGVDTGALVPHIQHCEDMSWGLKVVNTNDW